MKSVLGGCHRCHNRMWVYLGVGFRMFMEMHLRIATWKCGKCGSLSYALSLVSTTKIGKREPMSLDKIKAEMKDKIYKHMGHSNAI